MTDDIRWRGPRPDDAATAAEPGDGDGRARTRGSGRRTTEGEAPLEAKRPHRRRRRGRGRKSASDQNAPVRAEERAQQPRRRAEAAPAAPKKIAAAPKIADPPPPSPPEASAAGQTRARRGARRRGPIYAALDLGTNNCRLLVARAEGEAFQIIDAFSRVVRLGEGLSETGRLSEAAIDRSVAALAICADRIAKHRALRLRAIATEACRRAENQRVFLERVREETGIQLDVIAAEHEARLAVAGCAPLLDVKSEELLVFDIGGGSTELIWIDLSRASAPKRRALLMALAHGDSRSDRARAAARHIIDWVSIPVGVVTLGEAFDRIEGDEARFEAMHAHVDALVAPFLERNGPITSERLARMQVLGTSGTITTLAGVHLNLERYSRRAVDGLWIGGRSVERVIDRLATMNGAERAAIPCIGEDRATNLMAGAAILRAILRAWPTHRLRVADRGLREGMLYGLIQDGLAAKRRRESGQRRGGEAADGAAAETRTATRGGEAGRGGRRRRDG